MNWWLVIDEYVETPVSQNHLSLMNQVCYEDIRNPCQKREAVLLWQTQQQLVYIYLNLYECMKNKSTQRAHTSTKATPMSSQLLAREDS